MQINFPSLSSRPSTQKSRTGSPERRGPSTAPLSSTIKTNIFTLTGTSSSGALSAVSSGSKDMKQLMRTSLSVKNLNATLAASTTGSAAQAVKPKYLDGQLMCVFVSDMSGVTSLMRKLGVVHVTSQIMKMREILEPIIHSYRCHTQEREADDLVCTFRNPLSALAAAFECLVAVDEYNSELKDDDFKVKVSGIALETGSNIQVDGKTGDLRVFGPAMSRASYLGQFICEGGQILIGVEMYERIKTLDVCKTYFTFTKRSHSEWIGPGALVYYEMDWRPSDVESIMGAFDALQLKTDLAPAYKGDREADFNKKMKPDKREFLNQMKARDEAQSEQELALIDKAIKDQWMIHNRCVLYAYV